MPSLSAICSYDRHLVCPVILCLLSSVFCPSRSGQRTKDNRQRLIQKQKRPPAHAVGRSRWQGHTSRVTATSLRALPAEAEDASTDEEQNAARGLRAVGAAATAAAGAPPRRGGLNVRIRERYLTNRIGV